ncbi:delta 9 fatty acid desaturase [Tieghemostelium lacteum]|uniref:Delta 9 fatty acid desaturase n=1 Tax=Tieghemostelium lacteum TaxID=361077 RepID=A0A151ZCN7_TIELA|nr:delta 9 fatty acid desaturase [Tieghemostelium lacteum]|eukprot:KYQ91701.1 delta 9 fatty acid desaturase [Tieghemostelium lacteum]
MLSKLPKDVYEKSTGTATKKLLLSIGLVSVGVILVHMLPWYLLPIGWVIMGTACCGLFAIGYACGNDLFFKNKGINYLVGTLCMLPLMYPLEYWKNKIDEKAGKTRNLVSKLAMGHFWWLSSIIQWVNSNFTFNFSAQMIASVSILYVFIALFFPLMTYGFGLWGLFKFYIIPLFVYHFWMSTFIKASNLSFINDSPTFFTFPKWVQYLTQDFNIGLTLTHLSNNLRVPPSYKWKEAYMVLKEECKNITELSFSDILTKIEPAIIKSIEPKNQTLSVEFESSTTSTTPAAAKKPSKFDGLPWYSKVQWTTTIFITLTPILSIYGMATTDFHVKTYITAFLSYYIAGIGITAGYHRLFSHRSYDATWPVRVVLTLMGSTAFEMSVIDWCHDHRAHHRFTDTDKDPYNVKKGFFWAHMGWLIFKREEEPDADVTDLKNDWVLYYQHKYYMLLSFGLGIFLPMWICGNYWGDWRGGFFVAGIASKVLMMQCTFCINSLAHYLGEATYTDQRSPRDSAITSLVTFGEGYHNFHHEFPYDYRNGIHLSAYDPGKWLICFLSWFGLTYNLKRFPAELFVKGKIQMAEKKIQEQRKALFWGKDISQLPSYTRAQVKEMVQKEKKQWIIISDVVYDLAEFNYHPGGQQFIDDYIGKDATKAFNGVVYDHSFAARNILDTMRVGLLVN